MRSATPRLLLCVGLAVSIGSCAISSGRPDGRAAGWTRAYLDARCRYHVRCEAQFALHAPREQAVCHPGSWATVLLERAERVGTTFGFDEASAEACLDAIEAASCRVPYLAPFGEELAACGRAVHGIVPPGGACDPTLPGECADEGTCVVTEDTCGGECRGRAQRGEPCLFTLCADELLCTHREGRAYCRAVDLEPGAACVPDERCRDVDDVPHVCTDGRCAAVPTVAIGEACAPDVALCPEGAGCVEGTCIARLGVGEPCRSSLECEDGLWCAGAAPDARCAVIEPVECEVSRDCPVATPHCVRGADGERRCSADATGESCQGTWFFAWTFYAPDSCPDTHRCSPAPDGASLCFPIVAEGAGCDAWNLCPDGTRCESGVCTAVVGPGDGCDPDRLCPLTHQCEGGSCAPLPTLGEPCDLECFEGGCVEGRCQLLLGSAPCDSHVEGWIQRCEGTCLIDECGAPTRAGSGAPCGGRAGPCEHGLFCTAQPDDTGICSEPCEE